MRGHKGALLSTQDYNSIQQCETLDDIKLFLVRHCTSVTSFKPPNTTRGCVPLVFGPLHCCHPAPHKEVHIVNTMQAGTDYGPYLANEAPPLHTSAIVDSCTRRLADAWEHMRCNADAPLSTFLDFCTYGHMIDNVVLIVTGLLHERDVQVRYLLPPTPIAGAQQAL